MPDLDTDRLLALLRDPNVESQEIAGLAGVPREEAGRASRLLMNLARAKPEDVATLPAPLAAALGRAAATAGRADVLAALVGHAAKEVAKEAKRGLHVLRARGVAVPEPPRPAPPAPAAAAEPAIAAYATAVDGHGERAIWLPRNVPGKGIEVAQAVVSDVRGLLELQVGLLGRKEWRVFVKGLVERGAAHGLGEIAAARGGRARRGRAGHGTRRPASGCPTAPTCGSPSSARRRRRRIPALAFAAPLPGDEEREALAASAKLHDLPLLRGWLAEEDFLRALAAKLDEVAVSPLYLDERQRLEGMTRRHRGRRGSLLRRGAPRASLSARLFAAAEHLDGARRRGRTPALAAAAARALAGGRRPQRRSRSPACSSRRPSRCGDAPPEPPPARGVAGEVGPRTRIVSPR